VLSKRINKWFSGIKQYLFFYRDGFFELPYLSNTPQTMVESLKKMPVTKHHILEQAIYSNNPFTKGVLRYREIEENLWLLVTNIAFKANVKTKAIYDGEPNSYYFLSFSLYETEVEVQNTSINKINFPSKSWSLYRPGTEIDAYHFKGTSGLFSNFAFSETWLEKNLGLSALPADNHMKQLLNSKEGFIFWEDIIPIAEHLAKEIWGNLEKENDGHFNVLHLKMQTLNIITQFFKNVNQISVIENTQTISDSDRKCIIRAEKIIKDNLSLTFPGIDFIANSVSLSPTKLKACFKEVYGKSILQYYKEKKMLLAMQLIKNSEMPIKNISLAVGYESAGKFSTAFKQQFGVLPSEIRSN
jgi:AraC-like DNA-binding protein